MPKSVTIQLITAGATTGPFDLYSNLDGFAVPFETGVSKQALVLGYTSDLVPNDAIVVRIQSNSLYCTNKTDIYIGQPTTTTTTTAAPTTTTTTTTSTTTTSTTAAPTTSTTTTTTTAPTTTTTSTSTTTTTLFPPTHHGIALCGTNWDGTIYTQLVAAGTFTGGDIVLDSSTGLYYVVQYSSSTNPGAVTFLTVSATGLLTCPTTTTSTTTTTTTAAPTTTTTTTTTSTTTTTTTGTTTTTTTIAPSSALFGRGSSISAACSSLITSPITYYWANGVAFGPGITLYSNPSLTRPVTTFTFVAYEPTTSVYNIGSGNGIVGSFAGAC